MDIINWILNVAVVVLWIDWRSGRAVKGEPSVLSLASAVRPIEKRRGRGFGSLATLLLVLLVRPIFYWSLGASMRWTPRLDLLAIAIPWRSDLLDRISLYSTLSAGLAFGFYYSTLLLLSVAGRSVPAENPMQRFVKLQLGVLDRMPSPVKILLPSMVAILMWVAMAEALVSMGLLPPIPGAKNLWGQGLALGIAALLVFRWILVAIFLAHFVNIYVYLGTHPVWVFVSHAARKLLWPVSVLRFAKVDLAPLAGMAGVMILSEFAIKPLAVHLFQRFIT